MRCLTCEQPIDASTVYRCYDCDREYCKACLKVHCARCTELDGMVREFDAQFRTTMEAAAKMRAAGVDRWGDSESTEMVDAAIEAIEGAYLAMALVKAHNFKTAGLVPWVPDDGTKRLGLGRLAIIQRRRTEVQA